MFLSRRQQKTDSFYNKFAKWIRFTVFTMLHNLDNPTHEFLLNSLQKSYCLNSFFIRVHRTPSFYSSTSWSRILSASPFCIFILQQTPYSTRSISLRKKSSSQTMILIFLPAPYSIFRCPLFCIWTVLRADQLQKAGIYFFKFSFTLHRIK